MRRASMAFFSKTREQTADQLFLRTKSQPEYLKIIPEVIKEGAKDAEESKELIGLIDQAAAKPPAWLR